MKLKMTVTFDPFLVSAPEVMAAVHAVGNGDKIEITTHPARETSTKPKAVKSVKA
jgi:hypothetical protein